MLVVFLITLSLIMIVLSLSFTKQKRKKRILVGIGLILYSIISYPLLVPAFGELMALEGVVSLMVMNIILLIGGILTSIVGMFTKDKII
ncbi:hypothetical protein [Metabacillus litoralis]|uniref:hypothetical protein n=1 Tax=Metabacillus litoralis TaxID=152268 RepID=UPI0020407671|nr:hypothetical protein [Metabacillus litoralis]